MSPPLAIPGFKRQRKDITVEDHPTYQTGPEPDEEPELDSWPTTDELVAMARAHRQGEAYPTPARLLENLPIVMRGLCDDVLSGGADAYHIAYAIASLIEVIEQIRETPPKEPLSDHAH